MAAAADRRPARRLGRRLLGRVLVAGFALTVVFSLIQAGLDYRRRIADLREDRAFIEAQYGRALAEALWKMDRSLVGAQVVGIRNRPYYVHVAVVENGVTTHEVGQSPAGTAIRWELPLSFEHRGRPVPLGTLQVEADAGLVRRDSIRRFALVLLFQLATVGVTGAMLLSIFNRLVTRHLVTASRYFGTFAADGSDPPLRFDKESRQDEIDLFAGSFNDLRERLGASQRNLRESEEQSRNLVEALRASKQILEGIINAIPVRVFWKDRNLVYLGCNAAFARDAGFLDPADIVGKDDYQMGWRAQADLYRGDDRQVIESGQPRLLVEEPQTTPQGKTITLLTSKIPLRDSQGEISGVLGIYLDISEQQCAREEKVRLEDQLRQAQKMESIGRLAGGVAHDFNNLTAIVLGYGEMLLGGLGPEDPLRKCAEQIVAAGRRSAALTSQLLAFGRKQTVQPKVLDLNALLRNFEKMLARLIGEDVELVFRLEASPGRIKGDPGQIEQVITNLAINARDAMPLGGSLTIETANVEFDAADVPDRPSVVPGKYVAFSVADTGLGMDRATLARLFEPYFTTKARGKGTGLGLATVYGIIKQSDGYIWAESEPGRGTTFRIYLPMREEGAAGAEVAEVAAGTEAPRGNGELILLVEDEAPLRELCASLLKRLGYRVSTAASGSEALQLVQERWLQPDLVVTDVIMPGMSGVDMTDRLRRARPDLGVLFMSGYPDDVITHHGVLEPGIPLIQKPFTEWTLATSVREVLARKTSAAPRSRSVLMIDDDEQYRDLMRRFCTKRGHFFAGVGSSAEALTALAVRSCDVLLVDLNIPGTDGARVLREIRAAGHGAPAIVLTGDVASADMNVLRPLGAVTALEKSGRAEPLLRAIEAACVPHDQPGPVGPRES